MPKHGITSAHMHTTAKKAEEMARDCRSMSSSAIALAIAITRLSPIPLQAEMIQVILLLIITKMPKSSSAPVRAGMASGITSTCNMTVATLEPSEDAIANLRRLSRSTPASTFYIAQAIIKISLRCYSC